MYNRFFIILEMQNQIVDAPPRQSVYAPGKTKISGDLSFQSDALGTHIALPFQAGAMLSSLIISQNPSSDEGQVMRPALVPCTPTQ